MTKLALAAFASIALIVLPLGLSLAWFMPALVKVDPALTDELRLAALIAAAGLALLPMSIFRIVLETHQRGYLVNASLLVQSLLITGLSLGLAWCGWGIPALALATIIGGAIFVSLNAWWAIGLLGTSLRNVRRARVRPRELISLCWPLAAAGAGNRVNLMTDAIVVGYFLGAGPVAVLFLTQRVILLAASQVNALGSATWAPLAELLASGDVKTFESRLAQLARLIVGCGVVLVGTVAAYNARFVRLWVGEPMYGGDLLAALTASAAVTFGFVCLFTWVIDMQGDTRRRLLVSSIGAILNLVLSIALVKQIGLAGVALGTLLAYLLTDAWYAPTLVCRRYGVRGGVILRSVSRAVLAGLPWAAWAWLFAHRGATSAGWIQFVAEVSVVGTLALGYCWFAILTRGERAEWHARAHARARTRTRARLSDGQWFAERFRTG
jgi:O-antigen/teichoic acid export membrane protein